MPRSLGACPKGRTARGTRTGAPRALLLLALTLGAASFSLPASAQKVRITNLSDVNFGLLTNLQADARRTQNICVFSSSSGARYSITASGSGPGASFALSNGTDSLPYEVEWNDQSAQTIGTDLASNVAATGRASAASHQACNTGPASSASLIILLRSSGLSQAREGNYSGSLTLLVAAE